MDLFGKRGLGVVLLGLLFSITQHAHAIDGLQISLQCSNVVLSWPSGGGHNYIVEYRHTLSATDSWQTLTSAWPDSGTNITVFVHSNILQNPSCGCGGGTSSQVAMGASSMATAVSAPVQTGPIAYPANDSGDAVPLALYPPNFDLTGFLIYDPLSGETVNGAGYTSQMLSPLIANTSTSGFSNYGRRL